MSLARIQEAPQLRGTLNTSSKSFLTYSEVCSFIHTVTEVKVDALDFKSDLIEKLSLSDTSSFFGPHAKFVPRHFLKADVKTSSTKYYMPIALICYHLKLSYPKEDDDVVPLNWGAS